jgi:hypothetical protein
MKVYNLKIIPGFFCILAVLAAAVFAACENPWMKEAVAPLYKNKDGGDNNDGGGGWGPAPVPTLYSIAEIEAWIAEQVTLGYGVSAASSIALAVDISLAGTGWGDLLQVIADANGGAGAYVKLDLSACTMGGPEFDPGIDNTGEQYVTALTLPTAAASVKAGSYIMPTFYSTFRYFSSLQEVNGEEVTTIGDYAFADCTSLTSASFPAAITINSAFTYCTNLTSVSLPVLLNVGPLAFAGCTGLTNISVDASPNFSSNGEMLMNKIGTTLIAWPSASGSVTLNGITIIGDSAFAACTGLTSVTLSAATTIDNYAFQLCTSLASVSLPATPPALGSSVFLNTGPSGTLTIHVPVGAVGNYTPATPPGWNVSANTTANGNMLVYGTNHKAISIVGDLP